MSTVPSTSLEKERVRADHPFWIISNMTTDQLAHLKSKSKKSPAITNQSQGSLRIHAMVAAWQSSTSCSRANATCCSTATQLDRSPGPPGSWAAARQLPRKPWSRAGQLPSTWREPKLSPRNPRDGMWTGFPAFVWRSVIDLVMCKARAIPAMRLAQFRHLWQPILGFKSFKLASCPPSCNRAWIITSSVVQ